MIATLSTAFTIVGWILVIAGWALKWSNEKKPMETKKELSILCFVMAIVLFVASIVIGVAL